MQGPKREIERMHPPPRKRISMEILVGVGLQAWCAVALKRFEAFTKSGNVQTIFIVLVTLSKLKKT